MLGLVMDDNTSILRISLTPVDFVWHCHPEEPNGPPCAIRERWMDQIEAALLTLHASDIVWGDVKADNTLIDEKNNAWLIVLGEGILGPTKT